MSCGSHKRYHQDGHDSKDMLNNYFSEKVTFHEDAMRKPMTKLHDMFCKGGIKGTDLYDFSTGPIVHQLSSAVGCFQNFFLCRVQPNCIVELRKWLQADTGAFTWDHAHSISAELEGKSDQSEEKNMQLKLCIKKVVKCDVGAEGLVIPAGLSQADCILTAWFAEVISQNQEDYKKNMREMLKKLKPGGNLIIIGVIDCSYYTAGGHTFHVCKCDENFVKSFLVGEGCTVLDSEVFPRKSESDLTDYGGILCVHAQKRYKVPISDDRTVLDTIRYYPDNGLFGFCSSTSEHLVVFVKMLGHEPELARSGRAEDAQHDRAPFYSAMVL